MKPLVDRLTTKITRRQRIHVRLLPARTRTDRQGASPECTLGNGAQLPALATVATRAPNGDLDILVINQDPGRDVTATVRPGLTHTAAAQVATLNGPALLARNVSGDEHRVAITQTTAQVGAGEFSHAFPAHSVTRIHLRTG